MAKKDFTLTSKILLALLAAGDTVLVSPYELKRRIYKGHPLGEGKNFATIAYYLAKKGWIKYIDKNNERFVKLTKNGELEALLSKARIFEKPKIWDKKWRLIIFDIPEDSYQKRHFFRSLLKKNGFKQLQASVYVSPFPLKREAIKYLEQSKLINFIRIIKVEEMDNDSGLKKKFGLI